MKVFLTLVNNDMDIFKYNRRLKSSVRKWYALLAVLFGLILATTLIITKHVNPYFINVIPAFVLYAAFPIGIVLIKREWKSNTVSWWLQLPYSRKLLLGAKLTASFIRVLQLLTSLLIISLIIWFEGMLLRPEIWNEINLVTEFGQITKMYVQTLCISPLLITFGMLVVVLRNTRYRFINPFLWIVLGGILSVVYSTFFETTFIPSEGVVWSFSLFGLNQMMTYIVGIAVVIIVTIIFFILSSLLLGKSVEV